MFHIQATLAFHLQNFSRIEAMANKPILQAALNCKPSGFLPGTYALYVACHSFQIWTTFRFLLQWVEIGTQIFMNGQNLGQSVLKQCYKLLFVENVGYRTFSQWTIIGTLSPNTIPQCLVLGYIKKTWEWINQSTWLSTESHSDSWFCIACWNIIFWWNKGINSKEFIIVVLAVSN